MRAAAVTACVFACLGSFVVFGRPGPSAGNGSTTNLHEDPGRITDGEAAKNLEGPLIHSTTTSELKRTVKEANGTLERHHDVKGNAEENSFDSLQKVMKNGAPELLATTCQEANVTSTSRLEKCKSESNSNMSNNSLETQINTTSKDTEEKNVDSVSHHKNLKISNINTKGSIKENSKQNNNNISTVPKTVVSEDNSSNLKEFFKTPETNLLKDLQEKLKNNTTSEKTSNVIKAVDLLSISQTKENSTSTNTTKGLQENDNSFNKSAGTEVTPTTKKTLANGQQEEWKNNASSDTTKSTQERQNNVTTKYVMKIIKYFNKTSVIEEEFTNTTIKDTTNDHPQLENSDSSHAGKYTTATVTQTLMSQEELTNTTTKDTIKILSLLENNTATEAVADITEAVIKKIVDQDEALKNIGFINTTKTFPEQAKEEADTTTEAATIATTMTSEEADSDDSFDDNRFGLFDTIRVSPTAQCPPHKRLDHNKKCRLIQG